jgi:hypothetical protein
MKWRGILVNLLVALMFTVPCIAAVVSSAVPPATRATGFTVTSAIWNADVGGIYSYINNNIVPALNKLTAKGDLYVYDGANLQAQAVGADGTVLTANSGVANGINWAVLANTTQLTTKGDLLTYAGSAVRMGVGTNGQVLTANSGVANGIEWATSTSSIPVGSIIAWSPAGAGTSTVPSGWTLCDGSAGAPNLIGRFIIGSKPAGSVSAAAVGGYGDETVDATGTGAVNHTHSLPSAAGTTSNGASSTATAAGTPGAFTASTFNHTHTFTAPSGTSGATTSEPADYALVYIMKL